ncbi:MAG: 3-deoxy-manno-octulosonate cytidylyltransferase [Pseudomonas sp.]|nr:3-deoxy-manno-octulosonate cytidylyltransferase [Pseudomonas sp.]
MSASNVPYSHVVIPARYGSSRLPAKPLLDLVGLPMIVRVFNRVRSTLPDTDVVVAIDDQRIATVLEQHGVPYVLTAPEHPSGTDRIAEVARIRQWPGEDIIINVQGDEPLVPASLLSAFSALCRTADDLQMASIVAPLTTVDEVDNPNIVKVALDQHDRAIFFSRSAIPFCRELPKGEWPLAAYHRHIGIYAYRCSVLRALTQAPVGELEGLEKLEQLRALWLGYSIRMLKWPTQVPHGVDTPQDAERVRQILIGGTE